MNNFWQRGLTGLVFVAVIIAAITINAWLFHLVFGIIAIAGLTEFYTLFEKSKTNPNKIIGVVLGLIIYATSIFCLYKDEANQILLGTVLFTFGLLSLNELYRKKETPFENIAITVLGLIYIIVPMLLINRMIEFNHETGAITNAIPVLTIFILVWCSDTFAYLFGRAFGKHKLFERISPKKSWEGFLGGLLMSMLAGYLIAHFTDQNEIQFIFYGILVASFGTIGDLIESMLKRSLKIKDSGKILPGHGGILDRFDAVLFVIPIIYYFHLYIF